MYAFLALVACVYAYGAWRQGFELNLSETAGGQGPYLSQAARMAEDGVANYFGDRNRMPAIPAFLSLFYHDDAVTFFLRSKWVAILTSMAALGGLAWLLIGVLPRAAAVLMVSVTAFAVFLPKASFVQAELLYYTLFFATWLLMCRLLYRPNRKLAIAVGLVAGLSYWVKASVSPLVLAFLFASAAAACFRWWRRPSTRSEKWRHDSSHARLASAGVVLIVFIAVISPYVLDSKARFGHYFYNVNSTFFMWCDSWPEAKSFADQYKIGEQYPAAPREEIPSVSRYFRTHSLSQAATRLAHGFATLGHLFWRATYGRYLLALGIVGLLLAWRRGARVRELTSRDVVLVAFTLVVIAGYLTVYAWYALVAFGDRFILSLFLPVLFAEWLLISRTATPKIGWKPFGLSLKLSDALATVLIVVVVGQGVRAATNPLAEADDAFVHFYFNETREAQLAGHVDVATRGYQGVIQLDPTFAAAHHELGLIALGAGRSDQAIAACREAVHLSPDDPNFLNSLGSALIQAGATEKAIAVFEDATEIEPDFVSALYNLGGAYSMTGHFDRAEAIARRLDALDPQAAGTLRSLVQRAENPKSDDR